MSCAIPFKCLQINMLSLVYNQLKRCVFSPHAKLVPISTGPVIQLSSISPPNVAFKEQVHPRHENLVIIHSPSLWLKVKWSFLSSKPFFGFTAKQRMWTCCSLNHEWIKANESQLKIQWNPKLQHIFSWFSYKIITGHCVILALGGWML